MRISIPEILFLTLLCLVLLAPTSVPVDPEVVPVPTVQGDVLDTAEDSVRADLAALLVVYADEDLTDSKFFDAFSAEFSAIQAKHLLPVSQILYKSSDLRATAKSIVDHKLGVN